MPEPLPAGLSQVRALLLDERLVRAVASGRRRGKLPRWRRAELRPVRLRSGRHLQVTAYDDKQAHTSNATPGVASAGAVDALLAEPFGNWHVETTSETCSCASPNGAKHRCTGLPRRVAPTPP